MKMMVDAIALVSIEASTDVVMDAPGREAKKEKRQKKPKVVIDSEGSEDEDRDFNMRSGEEGEHDDQAESAEDDSENQLEVSFVAEVMTHYSIYLTWVLFPILGPVFHPWMGQKDQR